MRVLIPLLCCILASCFYVGRDTTEDIINHPPAEWSSRDCLTIVAEAMHTNFLDRNSPNIKVIATAYTPWVVAAVNRMSQMRFHWSDSAYQQQLDQGLLDMSGLYIEPQSNLLVDSHGNFLHGPLQLDSLMFLVTLRNNSWPCTVPLVTVTADPSPSPFRSLYTSVPLYRPTDWPCYIPDITDLSKRIYLVNDNGITVKPKYVWGRKNNQLTIEETLLVMFPLHNGNDHLLAKTKSINLKLTGFDSPISLAFSIDNLFPQPTKHSQQPTLAR